MFPNYEIYLKWDASQNWEINVKHSTMVPSIIASFTTMDINAQKYIKIWVKDTTDIHIKIILPSLTATP